MTATAPTIPTLPCLCASFRRASRALTQLYEQALRPLGLRSSQFTILQVLSRFGELSQGQLGQILAMDSTTLTRTLAIMSRNRWIASSPGEDRRERRLRLSNAGEAQLKRAQPAWENAQAKLRAQLGDAGWKNLLQLTTEVADLAHQEGEIA